MKIPLLLKITAGLLILVLWGMFIFENLDPVKIWIPFFKARHYGLVYIILIAYLTGVLSAGWFMLQMGVKIKKRRKLQEISAEQDQELFEDE